MATSKGVGDALLDEGPQGELPAGKEGETSDNEGDADGNAHGEEKLRINPEALKGLRPLPGVDEIEVILVQPTSVWTRWTEGLMIHMVGSGLVAVLAFIAGLWFAEATSKAEEPAKRPPECIAIPVPAPSQKAD